MTYSIGKSQKIIKVICATTPIENSYANLWVKSFIYLDNKTANIYVEVSRNAKNGETKRQKINYEANNDRNLTKLNTHCLDLYQNEV